MVFLQWNQRDVLAYLLKHNPYHAVREVIRYSFLCLTLFEQSPFLSSWWIPKRTCMLEKHAPSKDCQAYMFLKWSWRYLSLRGAMKTNAVEKHQEQVLRFVVVFLLDSALPFQVPRVASLLSICLHTWMLVSFFLRRLSLFSVNFHFVLPEFSQLGTEKRAEKMFTSSHISLKKVSLASSGLFRDFCNKDPEKVC